MSASRPSARHRSREVALQVLYALDASSSEDAEAAFSTFADHFELPEGARAFAKQLVVGVAERREVLDREIAAHARNWRVERMAAVDRNLLRLATYEMRELGTPPQVAIDEAIELARRFGGEASPRFVNGVLDAVASGSSHS